MAFSADAKYLAAQLGGPEYLLHYYAWEKGKLLACIKTVGPQIELGHPTDPFHLPAQQIVPGFPVMLAAKAGAVCESAKTVHQIGICPTDACQVSVCSEKSLVLYRYSEGVLRFLSYVPAKQPNNYHDGGGQGTGAGEEFLCHCWLPGERVAVGTSMGKIYIIAGNEIVQELNFGQSPSHSSSVAAPQASSRQNNFFSLSNFSSVHSIVYINRGFIASGKSASNAVEVFDRYIDPTTKQDAFKMTWRLPLPSEDSLNNLNTTVNHTHGGSSTTSGGAHSQHGGGHSGQNGVGGGGGIMIKSSAVSGSEGSLIVELETNQLLKIALTWSELLKVSY
jgi:hypothetical protein